MRLFDLQPTAFTQRTKINTERGPTARAQLNPGSQTRLLRLSLNPGRPDSPQILHTLHSLQRQFQQSPFIREFTVSILSPSVGNNNPSRAAKEIAAFVRSNLRYLKDPFGVEYVISPVILLSEIARGEKPFGDCDDHVLMLNSMLGSIGIEARPMGVKLFTPDRYDHVISQAWIGSRSHGQWIDIDPCAKGGIEPIYRERLVPE